MKRSKQFSIDAERVAFDQKHRNTIRYNMSKYDKAVSKGLGNYQNLQLAKDRAAFTKRKMLKNWSSYLEAFEKNCTDSGGFVHWANDTQEAIDHLKSILRKHNPEFLMKSKSMTTEEIHLNEAVEGMGIAPIETDLGEFIVQVAGEKPYHILTPAMHKSKEDVAELFHKNFDTDETATPEELTKYVREYLRKKFYKLKVGITGANFLIAENGSVCLTENEGNGLMTTAFSDVHIVVAGIEKVLPKVQDLSTFWPLVAQAGTGQKITVYNTMFSAKTKTEKGGPTEFHVILLDNGRTDLFSSDAQFESLACIRCGACLNNCPIYHNVGGYTYNTVYSGPIGSVITPHLKRKKEFSHLSYACSLCGKCKEVCPVKIDLPEYLLLNRKESNKSKMDNIKMSIGTQMLLDRKKLDLLNGNYKNTAVKLAGDKTLGARKQLPKMPNKSFSAQYKSRKKK